MTLVWQGMLVAILLALATEVGTRPRAREVSYDVLEINHRLDETGKHLYSQAILWDWHSRYRRHHVEFWCLMFSGWDSTYRVEPSGYSFIYTDRQLSVVKIKAKTRIETWTDYDPERRDNEIRPSSLRRGLK